MIRTFKDISALSRSIQQRKERCFIIADRQIIELYPGIIESMQASASYGLTAEERSKDMETVIDLCRFLMENKADRNSVLISIGGGITSDIAGFTAAIYKRGIRYVSIPTTLLAQVDAAVGGKNGVNMDGYKNMLGTIRQPEEILYCTEFLGTLSKEEIESGWSETIKTALIQGGDLYERCLDFLTRNGMQNSREHPIPPELIAEISGIKCRIVEQDPFEKGLRRILNFGHTYGHAIEKWYMDRSLHITHGLAVAKGMILAAIVSEKLRFADPGIANRLKADFERIGLDYRCSIPKNVLDGYILQDKKAEGDTVHFAMIREIGNIVPVRITFKQLQFIDF